MENFLNKIPQFPGYVFDRIGTPKYSEKYLDSTGKLVITTNNDYNSKNYVIYKPDYSEKVYQLPELLPKSEFKNYVDVCNHFIVYFGGGTAAVWNVLSGCDLNELMNPLVVGFIPVKFKETK